MNRNAAPKPEPSAIPVPLPSAKIVDQLARGPLLLCLDFDGTIAELTNDPLSSVPIPRAKNAIAELARHRKKITVAIISGRDLDTLLKLLGLREGLLFAGTHGLEFIGRDGTGKLAPGVDSCREDIELVRSFIARTVPKEGGFIIEDKGLALTINYRNAKQEQAREVVAAFDKFVATRPTLKLLQGKMIREALPRDIGGKDSAIEFLMRDAGFSGPSTVYFGDDTTDEDAFHALAKVGGITVLVGAERASFAQYRIDRPKDVADLLARLATAVS